MAEVANMILFSSISFFPKPLFQQSFLYSLKVSVPMTLSHGHEMMLAKLPKSTYEKALLWTEYQISFLYVCVKNVMYAFWTLTDILLCCGPSRSHREYPG
jgi:hypothetical protein